MSSDAPTPLFTDLDLPQPLLQALSAVGYETPSPIQAATIPPLMAGRDVLGQAQTGTGKTAAFALPAMARLDPAARKPQVLVLAPTRELAIQVAEAFQKYAAFMPGFQVLPIYGGQGYGPQLQALRRGVQVIVGTPGRVIDHIEKGSLDLSELRMLVLDEADEMLRMGFIDDVEAVLARTPENRQVALFSATMPPPIRRIAQTYLKDPVEVAIKAATTTARNIRQRYWMVSGTNKLDAITRILEAEPFDAVLLDAPCTATGTIRRHPDLLHLKSEADITRLAGLQARFLDALAGGWGAFLTMLRWLAVAFGAVLPFLVVGVLLVLAMAIAFNAAIKWIERKAAIWQTGTRAGQNAAQEITPATLQPAT